MIHALDDVGHAARDLAHRDGGLDATADGVDARPQPQQVQSFVLLPDRVLGVDLGNVIVILLDGLRMQRVSRCSQPSEEERGWRGGGRRVVTFFSLFFSAVSSFPALAACLLSCLAVN